jgi:hypothetical protein
MALSHDDALLLAFRAELGRAASLTLPHDTTARIERKEEQ